MQVAPLGLGLIFLALKKPARNGFKQDVDKELKTINYDNTKTVRNIKEPVGSVDRLSVAVLVDGVTTTTTGKTEKTVEKWTPRTAEELAKYESIVKNAIGFDEKRGDVVKIENIKFQKEDFTESDRMLNSLERRKLISYLVKWGILASDFWSLLLTRGSTFHEMDHRKLSRFC